MDIQELFLREFEDFRFTEIHRNPPNSLLTSPKPNAKQYGSFFGILTDGLSFGKKSYGIPGKDAIEEELEKELKKQEPDFYDYLLAYMDKKGIADETELYKKAEVNRATFSKIRSMRKTKYRPGKPTVIKLCLALELTADETQEMLHTVGYGMSNSSMVDKIIMFFIKHNIYDIFEIDGTIHEKTNQNYLIDGL